jgi:hypothetical protein
MRAFSRSIACTALAAQAVRGQGTRTAWQVTDTGLVVPIGFTISGAVSLGSYQSGVNWTILSFFKGTNASGGRRAALELPVVELSAISGASAGNINGLISAMEWCSATSPDQPPEASLFWRIWTATGFQEVLPKGQKAAEDDGGIFDRSFFRRHHFRIISDWRAGRQFTPGCDVPIGVALTRVDAQPLYVLNDRIVAQNQRYAALYRVRTQNDSGNRLWFEQVGTKYYHPGLGAVVSLPMTDRGDSIPTEIADLTEASSAFPLAFAPKLLHFYDLAYFDDRIGCVPSGPRCAPPDSALFLDGGVFDNRPLDLALGLHALRKQSGDWRRIGGRPADSIPRLIYMDPGSIRDDPVSGTDQYFPRADTDTVLASSELMRNIVRWLGGAVATARDYEMQALARNVAWRGGAREWVGVTDRAHPLAGEHLHAFAAFLGKPLRMLDFYLGMYDGLHFIASDVLCDSTRTNDHTKCTREKFRTLLCEQYVPLSNTAAAILADLGRLPSTSPCRARIDAAVVSDTLFVMQHLRAAYRAWLPANTRVCRGDFIDKLLCNDGIVTMLDSLANDREAMAIIRRWAADSTCAHDYAAARPPCLADAAFLRALDKPHDVVADLINVALQEFRRSAARDPLQLQTVKGAEFAFISSQFASRVGRNLDVSTIPPYDRGWPDYLRLLPYSVGLTLGVRGWNLGWRPVYHQSPIVAFTAPFELSRMPSRARGDSSFRWTSTLGLGVLAKQSYGVATGVQFDVRLSDGIRQNPFEWFQDAFRDPRAHLGGEASVILFSNLFSVGLQRVPAYSRERPGVPTFVGTLKVMAANGLLYLLLR